MSIQVFCHVFFFFFFIRLFVPVILDCMSCFYILAISFLSVISFANIFSHSVVYLASLLRKSPETSLCPALGAGECVPACPQPSCQSLRSSSLTVGLVTPLQGSRTGMSSLLLMHASGQFPPVMGMITTKLLMAESEELKSLLKVKEESEKDGS